MYHETLSTQKGEYNRTLSISHFSETQPFIDYEAYQALRATPAIRLTSQTDNYTLAFAICLLQSQEMKD